MYTITISLTSFLQGLRSDVNTSVLEMPSFEELQKDGPKEVWSIVNTIVDETAGRGIVSRVEKIHEELIRGFESIGQHMTRHEFLVCLHGGITDGTFVDICIEKETQQKVQVE